MKQFETGTACGSLATTQTVVAGRTFTASNGVTTGTTFVLTQTSGNNANIGGVSITSENNVTLNAPSTGTYKGVLFYQDRRATVGTMTSTSKIFDISLRSCGDGNRRPFSMSEMCAGDVSSSCLANSRSDRSCFSRSSRICSPRVF